MDSAPHRPGLAQAGPRNYRATPHHRPRLAQDSGHALADHPLLGALGEEDHLLGRYGGAGAVDVESRAGWNDGRCAVLAGNLVKRVREVQGTGEDCAEREAGGELWETAAAGQVVLRADARRLLWMVKEHAR